MRIVSSGLAVAALLGVGNAGAQSPAPPSPQLRALQAFCFPFYGGMARERIAAAAEKAGFTKSEGYVKGVPVGFTRGPVSVHMPAEGDFCEVSAGATAPPGALGARVMKDIEAWSPTLAPAHRFAKTSETKDPAGNVKAVWTSPTGSLEVYEAQFLDLSTVSLTYRPKVNTVKPATTPPAVAAAIAAAAPKLKPGEVASNGQGCNSKPGSGKIVLEPVHTTMANKGGKWSTEGGLVRNGRIVPLASEGYTVGRGRAWFDAKTPIVFRGRTYKVYGNPRIVGPNELQVIGEHDKVAVSAEKGDAAADVIWILDHGLDCAFQPYAAEAK